MAETNPVLMSIRAYARHREVHHRAVQYAIERGAIPFEIRDGRKFIDPIAADKAWAENIVTTQKPKKVANEGVANETQVANNPKSLATPAPPSAPPAFNPPGTPEEDSYKYESSDPEGELTAGEVPALMRSKERSEVFKAKMAELDYLERSGALVAVEEVKQESFRIARQVRETLMGLPDRIAAELTAHLGVTVDVHTVHSVMDKEIRKSLEGLPLEK